MERDQSAGAQRSRHAGNVAAFTLLEVLLALFLLSIAALGLTRTLISAQRALTYSRQWMRATQLASEGMEQLRAGVVPEPGPTADGFSRTVTVALWNGHPALQRLEVRISWNDGEAHTLQLSTLARP